MNTEISRVKQILEEDESVILAYLFGSRANGTANKRSDWDFGIYFKEDVLKKDCWHDLVLSAKLSRVLKSEAQIINLNKEIYPILGFETIKNNGPIVNKDEEKRLELENGLMRNYYDWLYYYNRR